MWQTLTALSLPMPEEPGSIPVIGHFPLNNCLFTSVEQTKKEKEARNGPFLGKKESSFGVKRISNPRTIQDDVPG